jgi:methionyl-tRNA synthetase
MATVDDFRVIEMKIGTILTAEYVEGADKLLKLTVDFGPMTAPQVEIAGHGISKEDDPSGEKESGPEQDVRQILSGIREYYRPEDLVGKQCPFVTNLEPRTMRGLTSHGMVLAVGTADGGAVLLHPDKEVPTGSLLR